VGLHCDLANTEFVCDQLVQPSCDHQRHHLTFAAAEQRVTGLERPALRLLPQRCIAALDRGADRAQQHLVSEWLRQELHRARLHGLNRHRHVAVTRDEDDWHVDPVDRHPLLQIETVEVRKIDVQYQAAWSDDSWTLQEFLRGRKGLWLPARTADQQFQRFTHRNVVVYDEYDGCGG